MPQDENGHERGRKTKGGRRKLIRVINFGISDIWISKMAAVRLAGIRECCFLSPHGQILQ